VAGPGKCQENHLPGGGCAFRLGGRLHEKPFARLPGANRGRGPQRLRMGVYTRGPSGRVGAGRHRRDFGGRKKSEEGHGPPANPLEKPFLGGGCEERVCTGAASDLASLIGVPLGGGPAEEGARSGSEGRQLSLAPTKAGAPRGSGRCGGKKTFLGPRAGAPALYFPTGITRGFRQKNGHGGGGARRLFRGIVPQGPLSRKTPLPMARRGLGTLFPANFTRPGAPAQRSHWFKVAAAVAIHKNRKSRSPQDPKRGIPFRARFFQGGGGEGLSGAGGGGPPLS